MHKIREREREGERASERDRESVRERGAGKDKSECGKERYFKIVLI